MSGVFVLAPVLASGPMVLTAATAVAVGMGFIAMTQGAQGIDAIRADLTHLLGEKSPLVAELDIEAKGMTQLINEQGPLVLERADATILFQKGKGNRVQMLVKGKGQQTMSQLEELGQEVMNRVQQQYAYHSVVSDLKKRGFAKAEESVEEDGTIRLRLRRWD